MIPASHFVISFTKRLMKRRLEKETIRPDFLARMIAEREQNNTSFQELQSQANLLVIAGSETTATALSGITYYLCRNPAVFHKVAQEVRQTFDDYDLITGRSTEPLTYLKAVIDEGLRLYPPIPTGPPRVSPGEKVSGYFVPKGTVVSVSSWSATHSERNFHRPYDFIPERWIDATCNDDKSASQPFLLGSRGCLGRK
jgi:cytochrome P450